MLIVRHRGGRFLRRDEKSGSLYEVGDEKAEAKTSQALREGLDVRATKTAANTLMGGQQHTMSNSVGDGRESSVGKRRKAAAKIASTPIKPAKSLVNTSTPTVGAERTMPKKNIPHPIHSPGFGITQRPAPQQRAATAPTGYYPPYLPQQRYDDPYHCSRYPPVDNSDAPAAVVAVAGYDYGARQHPPQPHLQHLQQHHHHYVHHYAGAAQATTAGGYHYPPSGYNTSGYTGDPSGAGGGVYPSPTI